MEDRIYLFFIVNGADVKIDDIHIYGNLGDSRDRALRESNNTGREFYEWEIHNDKGERLQAGVKIKDQNIQSGDRLFLNLEVGIGG